MREGAALADLLQELVGAVALGSIYALFSVGLAIAVEASGTLNLAHVVAFTGAALVAWALATALPLPLAAFGGTLVAAAFSAVAYRLALAPLANAVEVWRPLVAGLAVAMVLDGLARRFFGDGVAHFPRSALTTSGVAVGPLVVGWAQLLAPAVLALLLALWRWLATETRFGLALRALAANPAAARLMTVDVPGTLTAVFAFAGFCGGAAGVLYALSFNSATLDFSEPLLLRGLAVTILGGMGSISGAVVGGFALALIEGLSVSFLDPPYRDALVAGVLLLTLVWRPLGLLGEARRGGLLWRL